METSDEDVDDDDNYYRNYDVSRKKIFWIQYKFFLQNSTKLLPHQRDAIQGCNFFQWNVGPHFIEKKTEPNVHICQKNEEIHQSV